MLREIPAENPSEHNPGDQVLADIFEIGDQVDIIGKSKGKGFAGTIKALEILNGGRTATVPKTSASPVRPVWRPTPAESSKARKCPANSAISATTVLNLRVVDVRAGR